MRPEQDPKPRLLPKGLAPLVVGMIGVLLVVLVLLGLRFYDSPFFIAILAALVLVPPLVFALGSRRILPHLNELDKDEEEDEGFQYPKVPEYLKNKK